MICGGAIDRRSSGSRIALQIPLFITFASAISWKSCFSTTPRLAAGSARIAGSDLLDWARQSELRPWTVESDASGNRTIGFTALQP
eukprot:3413862-Rhodomonas_salina.3